MKPAPPPERDRFGMFKKRGVWRERFLPPSLNQNRDKRGRFMKGHHPFEWKGRAGFGIGLPYKAIVINND